MSRVLWIGGLLLALLAHAQQQTGSPAGIPVPPPPPVAASGNGSLAPESLSFRIRLLDGRNGAPVSGGHVKLWYDEPSGPGYTVVTDAHGIALMPAPVGEPVRLVADVTGTTDCRRSQRYTPKPAYSLNAIASAGAAAENTCGDIAVHTSPGELVLFVRPSRWYEKLNRNGDPNVP